MPKSQRLCPRQRMQPWPPSQEMLVPPKEGERRGVPIRREGRHENNPAGAAWSSTLPSVPAASATARTVRAGRAGAPGSSTASRLQKGRPGAPWQGKLGGLRQGPRSGVFTMVSPAPSGGTHV